MTKKQIKCDPKKKGNICRGYKRADSKKRKCNFGVNKNTGKCLKYPRRKK